MSSSAARVPQLDLRRFDQGSDSDRAAFVADLGQALRTYGFVGIREHGLDEVLVGRAYEVLKQFFALPTKTKMGYHVPGGGGARGYTAFGVETAKDAEIADLKEFWHVGRTLPADSEWAGMMPANLWPSEVEGFREVLSSLYAALDSLGGRMLRAIALHLGLDEDWFADKVDHGNCVLRPIHYPALDGAQGADGAVRSAAHGDINLITLLVGSGEPGLEIFSRKGEWIPVSTIEGVVVCNVGDILERLTNNVLPSTLHRVVNPPEPWRSQPRYSLPFFVHPNPEFVVETLPECVSDDNPNRYPEPITADAFLLQRLREIKLF
ncbi:2OG-Fe(II) oxygenase superfamily protein [Enhygromyxa salina]|uniref:2-oxoglutarate-dependent ethylene/succinate-forming enzyme n=1 Tax=Enhygromyxa salina TaxID=215803 RepID=A0A2S9YHH0_9BACT|nr:2-oxoglutarate and iron-dependent oxygenase domain-containing protein [Enhygromyxa salina]PRQ04550.1 2OG-Fe(II) oxygenase superfamily protein [Enhygromyxa salina]